MKGGWGRQLAAGVTCAAALGAPGRVADAQEDTSGLTVTGTVEAFAETDDNRGLDESSPGSETTIGTRLSFDVRSETPSSLLALSFGATLQEEERAGPTQARSGFLDPFVSLDFSAQSASSRLTVGADYQVRDLEDELFDDPETFIEEDLIISGGELETIRLSTELMLGVGGPVEGSLAYSLDERSYSDTDDPDLSDRRTDSLRLTGSFSLSQTATLRGFAALSKFEEDNAEQTERTTRSAGFGLNYAIDPLWTLDAELSFDTIEETELVNGLPTETDNDGLGFSATLERELPNGALTLAASREIGTTDTRTDLTLGRTFDLPSGQFALTAGVSGSEDGDETLIGSLDYQREFPTGVLTASFQRRTTFDDDDEQRVQSFLAVAYSQDLTPVAGLRFGLNMTRTDSLGGEGDESTRANAEVTYVHELAEDWDFEIGYRARYREDADGDSATSNAIVTSIARRFSLRP